LIRYCLLALFSCLALLAQSVTSSSLESSSVESSPVEGSYVPLTLGQSYIWSVHQMFDWDVLFAVGARAGLDHMQNNPSHWGHGFEGYADRLGSEVGMVAVRENIAFGVRALDHEDPRYIHSGQAGVLKRARHAIGQTFVARNARGDTMPAYSIFASGLATPFVADAWRPEPVNAGRELRSGGITIGMKAANNLFLEFWPDIRKKLRR
jgi:hypothetical protein